MFVLLVSCFNSSTIEHTHNQTVLYLYTRSTTGH